jgi:putative ABC transport system ATP-binding protein
VAIARALVNDASVILADEPTGNLDSRTSRDIMDLFTKLNDKHGRTIIQVTHEPDMAAYGKRVLTFRDGMVLKDERTGRS